MRVKKFLVGFVITLLLILIVHGFSTVEITAPDQYSTSATVTVNVSGGINASSFPFLKSGDIVGVNILNRSSSTGEYNILSSSASLTVNATNTSSGVETWWNFTATLTEGDRHRIRLNFTNATRNDDGSFEEVLTSERTIDIDIRALVLEAPSIKVGDPNVDCGATTRGLIMYNTSLGFIGCTEAGWKGINGTVV